MSIIQSELISCPHCKFLQERQVARSVNAQRAPHLREQVLAGTFHRTVCDGCHRPFDLVGRFLYVDFGRGHWFAVLPKDEAADLEAEEALLADAFRKTVIEAPPIVRELGDTTRVRLVFGVGDLREKIVILDAGLDDLSVELLKLSLNAAAPEGFALEGGARIVLREADAEALRFAWVTQDEARSIAWPVERATYDAVVTDAAHAAVRDAFVGRYWIDARRLLP